MPRLLFKKTGNAVWISHLDLMRLFQRAFKRAGLELTHTQGFNPRPSVSIAMPLSVGIESQCELLDFSLDQPVENDMICRKLNSALVDGVHVQEVYDQGDKVRDLAFLDCEIIFRYDSLPSDDAVQRINEFFLQEIIEVEKKSKSGSTIQNIRPMIKSIECGRSDSSTIWIHARVCCQNPSLNPTMISQAVCLYMPALSPSHVTYKRIEIYDSDGKVFR